MSKRVDPISFFIKVRGKDVEITLDPWISDDSATAAFRAKAGGKDFRDDTLEGLRKKLMAATRSEGVKVKVPFARLDAVRSGYSTSGQWAVRTGVALGLHGGNGNLLVRWDDRKATEQLESTDRWSGKELLRPLDDETARRLVTLKAQQHAITKELDELTAMHSFKLKEEVQRVIDARLDGEDERDEDAHLAELETMGDDYKDGWMPEDDDEVAQATYPDDIGAK